MSDESLSMSVSAAGRRIGVGRTKVMDLVRSGRLKAVVLDNRIHIVTQSVETLHASLPAYVPSKMPDLHPRNPLPKPEKKRARQARK
jgi:hypothetical protein